MKNLISNKNPREYYKTIDFIAHLTAMNLYEQNHITNKDNKNLSRYDRYLNRLQNEILKLEELSPLTLEQKAELNTCFARYNSLRAQIHKELTAQANHYRKLDTPHNFKK